jgi:hypothetical protein
LRHDSQEMTKRSSVMSGTNGDQLPVTDLTENSAGARRALNLPASPPGRSFEVAKLSCASRPDPPTTAEPTVHAPPGSGPNSYNATLDQVSRIVLGLHAATMSRPAPARHAHGRPRHRAPSPTAGNTPTAADSTSATPPAPTSVARIGSAPRPSHLDHRRGEHLQ